jgi:dephospho-CoA kinase
MMKKGIKVGLLGEFRSGKNTVADYLTEHYGAAQFAFATDLKNGFHREFPHIPADPKPRKGYQLYGELKRYVYGLDYWINLTLDDVKYAELDGERFGYVTEEQPFFPVITDVRYPNEAKRLEDEDYIIIKVVTPLEVKIARAKAAGDNFDPATLNHESEIHIKDMTSDYVLINDSTLEDLHSQIEDIMTHILGEGETCS